MLHTILGANGSIANELVPILLKNKEQVKLVSRNPKPVEGTETVAADASIYDEVLNALQGSDVVYLLIGLDYKIDIWREKWPKIMRNAIDACKAINAKLIFFDNVYMYGKVNTAMTEETAFKPVSKKGEVRAEIATMLLNEIKTGNIKALIARAADFYGPNAGAKSVIGVLAFDKLLKDKTPQTFINTDLAHSYSYTTDSAKALYILAKHDKAFGQTWHMPTTSPALTHREFIKLIAAETNGTNKIQVVPKFMLKVLSWFNPLMKELYEMLYQNEYTYVLDSSKFENAFNYKPTPYAQGVKQTIEWMKKQ